MRHPTLRLAVPRCSSLALGLLLLLTRCGPQVKGDTGPVDRGVCDDYLACAEALDEPMATLEALYGQDGSCWEDGASTEAERCRAACEEGLSVWVDDYPQMGVCLEEVEEPSPYPEGGWPYDTICNEDYESTGSELGEITYSTRIPDQFGQPVNLHDFCSHSVLIVGATVAMDYRWDALNAVAQQWPETLVVLVDLRLGEDDRPATVEDAAKLALEHGFEFPVLADGDGELFDRFCSARVPCFSLLGTGSQVRVIDDPELLDHLAEYLD